MKKICEKNASKKSGKLGLACVWDDIILFSFNLNRMRRFAFQSPRDTHYILLTLHLSTLFLMNCIRNDTTYRDKRIIKKKKRKLITSPKKGSRTRLSPILVAILQRCFDEELPTSQIARILGKSVSCITKRRRHYDIHGTCEYSAAPTSCTTFSQELLDEIEAVCEHIQTPTASDIVIHLPPHLRCSVSTCRRALKILNYSYKRVLSVSKIFSTNSFLSFFPVIHQVPDRRNTPATKDRRVEFIQELSKFPVEKVLSLDETGFNRYMHKQYAWSPIGITSSTVVPASRGRNVTLCAIMSSTGIMASVVHEGSMDTSRLLEFIYKLPEKKCRGKCLILDNVSFHRSPQVCS